MSGKFQFIHTTSDLSREAKKERRKLARSHVAALRHSERRQRDIKDFRAQNQQRDEANVAPGDDSNQSIPAEHRHIVDITPAPVSLPRSDPTIPIILSFDDVALMRPFDALAQQRRNPDTEDGLTSQAQFRHQIPLVGQLTPQLSPYQMVGQGAVDPFYHFIHMSAGIPPRMARHLLYYVNTLMPKMHPSFTTNITRKTFGCSSMATADELSLAALSAYSATSRSMAAKVEGFHDGVADWLYFKGRTIQLVNKRLSNPDEAISKDVIGGISSLILMESFTGNSAEAKAHMNGLFRIGQLRSRVHGPLPYILAFKILMSAIKLSILTQTPPTIPFNLSYPMQLPLPSISHILPSLASSLITNWPRISPNAKLLTTLHDIAMMTRYTEALYLAAFPYADDDTYLEYLTHQNMYIEYCLLAHTTSNVIEEACRLTCLLYSQTGLVRGYPNESAVIQFTLRPLKTLLQGSVLGFAWAGFEDVQAWVAFMGAWCSVQQDDLSFFAELFRKSCGALGLVDFEGVHEMLSRFLFVDRVYYERLRELWVRFF